MPWILSRASSSSRRRLSWELTGQLSVPQRSPALHGPGHLPQPATYKTDAGGWTDDNSPPTDTLPKISLAMDNDKALYTVSLCLAASLALAWKWRQNRNKCPYPPGPKGYPLIGNILDVPQDVPVWQAFIPMARKFGECPFDLWLDVI